MAKYSIDSSTLTGIGNAVRIKDGTTAPIPVSQLAERINAIKTGVELPTLTNPATYRDVMSGKEFIDGDGNIQWGSLLPMVATHDWGAMFEASVEQDSGDVYFKIKDGTNFGDATVDDVAAGKTFTSKDGTKLVGVASGGGGGSELVSVTIYLYGGSPTIGYQGADGPQVVSNQPGEGLTIEVVKGSIVVIEYSGSTYYVDRGGYGYETLYDGNPWQPGTRYTIMLSFSESGSVVFEEV